MTPALLAGGDPRLCFIPPADCATILPSPMQCPTCQTVVDDTQRFCPSCGSPIAAPPAAAPGTPEDPMIGQTLGGKYKVVRLLGEGGMGAVYEGEQHLGTTVRK